MYQCTNARLALYCWRFAPPLLVSNRIGVYDVRTQEGESLMKRLAVLSGLLLVGAISLLAAQQPQQPASLEIQKVKDNLYMITGGGGNTAAFITDGGVVVVDTKNPGNGQMILDKIKSVT